MKNDGDFIELRSEYSKDFHKKFNDGYIAYKNGDWQKARYIFNECLKSKNDGPCKTLLKFMGKTEYKAPKDWQGYRALTEK